MKKVIGIYLAVFLAVIMLISLYICISSFKTQMNESELSLYSVSANRLVGNIEDGLGYGKSMNNYYGLGDIAEKWAATNDNIANIKLYKADGNTVIYSMTDTKVSDKKGLNDSLKLEIKEENGKTAGFLGITVDLSKNEPIFKDINIQFLKAISVLILLGFLAILIFCKKTHLIGTDQKINKRRILIFMILLLLISQILFTAYSYKEIKYFFTEASINVGANIQKMIQDDVDKVTSKGVPYDQIYEFDEYASDVIEKSPIIESITLENLGEKPDRDGRTVKVNLKTDVEISQKYIDEKLRDLLIEMITAMVITMFLAAEIINYMIISIMKRASRVGIGQQYDKTLSLRVSTFVIHVACYLPISFIPIMMNELVGGDADNFILGLPTMVMFAVGFVFTLLAGGFCIKFGWKNLLFGGIALLIASSLMAGLIQTPVFLIISRGLLGAAYSLVFVAIREFATLSTDEEERSSGLAQITAGLYAGINIGAVVGSMICESLGYLGVFLISAVLGIMSIFIVKNYCVSEETAPVNIDDEIANTRATTFKESAVLIFRDKGMVYLTAFIVIPLALSIMFFDYFLPIYAVNSDVTSSDIGRAFLINGIAVAYGAPLIIKYISSKMNKKIVVFIFTLLLASGFFIFGFSGTALAILIASAVMGLAEGAALVSENMIMLDLPVAKKIGTSRLMSFYATLRKMAQTVGPQIFTLFMIIGYQLGMIMFGVLIAVCSVMYILFQAKKKRGVERESHTV